jgi:hypothetical protein
MDADERRARLRQMLEEAQTNATQASLAIGRSKDYLRDFLKGRKRDISSDEWLQLVEKLKPPAQAPAPPSDGTSDAEQRVANARRRQALERVFLELLEQIAAHAQDREELADPAYRRQVARLLAAGATAPLNPDVILGDGQMARHLVELWFHSLVRPESEQ